VENIIYQHPDVLEVAVIAVPDEKWGEVPKAFVLPKPGRTPSEQDIINHCKENLARFKAPKTVQFGELPKTATGKIQKFKLREKEWAGRERKVNQDGGPGKHFPGSFMNKKRAQQKCALFLFSDENLRTISQSLLPMQLFHVLADFGNILTQILIQGERQTPEPGRPTAIPGKFPFPKSFALSGSLFNVQV
jgi:hypothetical protein